MIPVPSTTMRRPWVPGRVDVVQVASSVARGHLMRGGVLRALLAEMGATVRTVTSTRGGAEFFACMTGEPPDRLGRGWDLSYGDAHDLDVEASIRGLLAYLAAPWRAPREQASLLPLLLSSRLVVNDIDPGLMLLQALRLSGRGPRLVNVISENSLAATVEALRGAGGRGPGRALGSLIEGRIRDCDTLVLNTLDRGKFFSREGNAVFLPPVVRPASAAGPARDPGKGRLVVAYLNPHFRSRDLFESLVAAARSLGAALHVVSEHASARLPGLESPGTRIVPFDAHLGDLIQAADAVVSGAGLALPFQCWVAGKPLVAVLSDHPEHRRNAEAAVRLGMTVTADGPSSLARALGEALEMRPEPHPGMDVRTREAWREILARHLAA